MPMMQCRVLPWRGGTGEEGEGEGAVNGDNTTTATITTFSRGFLYSVLIAFKRHTLAIFQTVSSVIRHPSNSGQSLENRSHY